MIPYTDAIFSKKEVLKILKKLAEEGDTPNKVPRPPAKRPEGSYGNFKGVYDGVGKMDNKEEKIYKLNFDIDK